MNHIEKGDSQDATKSDEKQFVEQLRTVGYVTEIRDDKTKIDVYPPTEFGQKPSQEKTEVVPRYIVINKSTGMSENLYYTVPNSKELLSAFWNRSLGRWEFYPD